jgi:ribosomal protein L21
MYAIVEIAGQQFKVVERPESFCSPFTIPKKESKCAFDNVLLIGDGEQCNCRRPSYRRSTSRSKSLKAPKR